jgi:Helix-turn-helix domain
MTEVTMNRNLSPDTRLQIRTLQKAHWFWIDNTICDRYADHLGLDGLGLYMMLARYANNHTAQCWPSAAHLATKSGGTVAQVAACLARLEAVGLIHVVQRPGACPLITLLDPRTTTPAPVPEPCAPPTIEPSEPVVDAYKEDHQEDLVRKTELSSLSSEPKEQEKSLVLCTRETKETEEVLPHARDPHTLSPYELPTETREAQAADALEGVQALRAAVWPTLPSPEAHERPRRGCRHRYPTAAGTHCSTCGTILEPAAAA